MPRVAAAMAFFAVVAVGGFAAAGERVAPKVGDAPPSRDFVDIEDERIDSETYRDWVQVITFADRKSSEEIKSWMGDAQIRATQAHPDLPVVYLSFADLAKVPRLMRRMVRPLLRRSFEKSNEELAESYRKVGIEPDPEKVAFRFIPDWDGSYLEAFGLDDAATYSCWIVANGRVVATFDASTPNLADRYVETFDRLASEAEPKGAKP